MKVIDIENTNLFGQFGFCVNINLLGHFELNISVVCRWSPVWQREVGVSPDNCVIFPAHRIFV